MVLTAPAIPQSVQLTKAFYSPAEIADLAGVSTSTILNYIKAGKLPAVRLSERLIRIPRKAVVRFLDLPEAGPTVLVRPDAEVQF
jgi:excisionase family DNA binding protein